MSDIAEGAKAPEFELDSVEGPLKLADFAGKAVVLYFYPKDDTTGCTKEAQAFTALASEFAKAGAVVIGVSKDSVKSHAKFATKYDLAVKLGSDPQASVIEAYGVWVEKMLYGRQYMGIERATFLIKDGVVKKVWRKVKVANHAAEVLAAVQAL